MPNGSITYRKVSFGLDDEMTHCELRWDSTDPILTGVGAVRSYEKSFSLVDILNDIAKNNPMTDPNWNRLG